MPGADLLHTYLAELRAQLPPGLGMGARARILREIEEHILAAAEDARAQGQPEALAVQQALARCGPPATIASGFQGVANLRRVHATRVGLPAAFALYIGLVGLTFLRYPAIAGSSAMVVFYLLVCAAILGGYAWVGLPTAQAATPGGIVLWRQGTTIGLLAGVLGTLGGLAANLALVVLWNTSSAASTATTLWVDHRIEEAALAVPFLVWFTATFVASVTATTRTGHSRTGLQLGLWSSIVYVVFSMVMGLIVTHLFANTLAQTVWAHDVFCHSTSSTATCAMGDDLGGMTNMFLMLPLVGIGLGWLGGRLGRQERKAPSVNDQSADDAPAHLRSIPMFVVWSCALFLFGVIGHIW